MNNNQTTSVDEDFSSLTGSDFEPVDVPQQQEEDVQEPLDNSEDKGNVQPSLALSQPQNMTAMNAAALNARIHWLEKQLLVEKTKKAQAETVGLKAMLEQQEKQEKQESDDQLDKMISELVGTKLAEKLQNVKENAMEETGKLIQAEFSAFKQGIEKRLDKFEQEGVAEHALKLLNKQLLKEWLTTGVGLLRNVSLVRVASNELITFGGWSIQDGRLKAKKNGVLLINMHLKIFDSYSN